MQCLLLRLFRFFASFLIQSVSSSGLLVFLQLFHLLLFLLQQLQSVLHLVPLAQTITSLQLQLFLVFSRMSVLPVIVLRLYITLQEMLLHLSQNLMR